MAMSSRPIRTRSASRSSSGCTALVATTRPVERRRPRKDFAQARRKEIHRTEDSYEFLKGAGEYFRLDSDAEFQAGWRRRRGELAEFLIQHADKWAALAAAGKESAERGRDLVQRVGCLNCHSAGGLENKYVAPSLAKIADEFRGCLAEKHTAESKAPDFGFSADERAALSAFLKTDRKAISRHSPIEFASRQTRLLNCNACHGQIELVPPLEVLGGKLKPEWAAAFMGGQPFKVRADKHPKGELWVEARMPSFASRARWIAEGMAMQQGTQRGQRRRDPSTRRRRKSDTRWWARTMGSHASPATA